MYCVNRATLIHFINGKCHIKQLKAGKSHKICLTNHARSILHHIMPLVINALGGGYTDTHILTCKPVTNALEVDTHTHQLPDKGISINQACTQFKNVPIN